MAHTGIGLLAVGLAAALPAFAWDLQIGVLSLYRPERLAVRSSEVLFIRGGSREFFLQPGSVLGLRAAGSEIDLFAQRQSSTSGRVFVSGRKGEPVEFHLNIDEKIDRRFRGRLEVQAVGSRLEPAITIDLEAAVSATVAAEMPAGSPLEALKAMAVLARSYYTASPRRHGKYDFCDMTHCQRWREPIAEPHPAAHAAVETAAMVVLYQGRPFAAIHHASCGGSTRANMPAAREVKLPPEPYPYFLVVCEPCLQDSPKWTKRFSVRDGKPLLGGLPEALQLASEFPSNNFRVWADGGEVIVDGRGEGHGVGVCRLGLIALANGGSDFRALLEHYLPQTRIARRD